MDDDITLKEMQKRWQGTFHSYLVGFFGSVLLTVLSFGIVYLQALPTTLLVYTIVALALIQASFQLIFFLHVGEEPHPRWETLIFFITVLTLLTIAIGSLWIMDDLHSRLMMEMD